MSVQGKFRTYDVTPVTMDLWDPDAQSSVKTEGKRVELHAATGPSGEDALFGRATPQGSIAIVVMHPDAVEQFEPGGEYYVTFERIDTASAPGPQPVAESVAEAGTPVGPEASQEAAPEPSPNPE